MRNGHVSSEKKVRTKPAAKLRKELAAMGYRFQFIPLDGFHALDEPASEPADWYEQSDVPAYAQP